jgi:hypothetical protein
MSGQMNKPIVFRSPELNSPPRVTPDDIVEGSRADDFPLRNFYRAEARKHRRRQQILIALLYVGLAALLAWACLRNWKW